MFSACLVGDFTKELPTASQIHSAHELAKFFLTSMPQYPNLKNWDQVKGHKEFNPTQCPGSNWKTAGDNLYNRIVNDKWQGYPNPQPVVAPPVDPTNWKKKYEDTQKLLDQANIDISNLKAKILKAQANVAKTQADLA